MTPVRAAGSVLGLLTGAWMVYVQQFATPEPPLVPCVWPCSPGPAQVFPTFWFAVVGGLLVLSSLASFSGIRVTFMIGAILSVGHIALMLFFWGGYPLVEEAGIVGLAAITAVVDAVASRPSRALAEKDSPLNLPVFG